jgi:two-component system sensor histidine kinase DesK
MTMLTPAEEERLSTGPRRWGPVFAAVWLFYLLNPLQAGWQQRGTVSGWVGMVVTVVFAAVYLGVFLHMRWRRNPGEPFRAPMSTAARWTIVVSMVALAAVDCVAVGQEATASSVYVAVAAVICLPSLQAWAVAVAVALSTYGATLWVPGWQEDNGILFGTLVATLAIWGITQAVNRNIEVLAMREENANLALADERNRFARDLHDILGHSLTVITVKAELANRLFDVDQDRARAELVDLERLSRDALADVRRAAQGYRELTLPGEIARARSALAAAEIEAELPNSTDEVSGEARELFAWTVREGITNVIRHSGARHCWVTLSERAVEICDDGRGAAVTGLGHGLTGLRERAAKVGGTVVTEARSPGFVLRVVVGR